MRDGHVRVLAVCLAAALLAACAGPRSCNMAGCVGSVIVHVAPSLVAGDPAPAVQLCIDDDCRQLVVDPVRLRVALGSSELEAPPMPDLDPDVDHVLLVTYIGASGQVASYGPEPLSRLEPNGHACGPTCFGAEVQLG